MFPTTHLTGHFTHFDMLNVVAICIIALFCFVLFCFVVVAVSCYLMTVKEKVKMQYVNTVPKVFHFHNYRSFSKN